jgi:acetyl-CoA synthetase
LTENTIAVFHSGLIMSKARRCMLEPRGSLAQIRQTFTWNIPARFNIATACSENWAASEPARIAMRQWTLSGPGLETTYGELDRLACRLANVLRGLGANRGDRIAILLPQCLEVAVAHLAIYKAAMIAVPLARLFTGEALEYRLKRAGVSVVLTTGEGLEKLRPLRAKLTEIRHIICIDAEVGEDAVGYGAAMDRARETFNTQAAEPDTPALIIFTSGTTGPPKGALHGHGVLLGHIPGVQIHHEFMPQPGDMAWTPADWAWAGGLLNILLPCLMLGVPVVYGGLDRFDAELAFRIMKEMKVANAFIPPTALRLMKTVDRPGIGEGLRLRTVGSGGESLGRDAFEWAKTSLGVSINEFYGQTECNLVLSSCHALGVLKPGAIGMPVPGHEVAVLGEDGTPCAQGERGQVAILRPDPVMFLGYWQDEAATKAKFIGDWMVTGDQCKVDDEGYFHFVGRDDDIINLAGHRVGPSEIEDCLASHPAVKLAAAVGKPDRLRTEIVKAYIVLAEGYAPNENLVKDIKAHVKARLAANIYPREIEFVDTIPLTTTGKVIRRVFREQARAETEAESR